MSDIYAMGGDPIVALNIVCFPSCLEPKILSEIMRGGQDKVTEAGALLVGGHSVVDDEPKYGLSVTGFVHPDRVMANNAARVGDVLILTKPLGIGIINSATKAGVASEEHIAEAVKSMVTLNSFGKMAIDKVDGVHAITDITGFGLVGHTVEMAEGSGVSIKIDSKSLPVIESARSYAKQRFVPGGAYKNRDHFSNRFEMSTDIPSDLSDVIYDPQTSGGLLISLSKEASKTVLERLQSSDLPYAIVGEVVDKKEKYVYFE